MVLQSLLSKLDCISSARNDRMSYREIDPTGFVVMVDLWDETGAEERTRVLDHTNHMEKAQRDREPQGCLQLPMPPLPLLKTTALCSAQGNS